MWCACCLHHTSSNSPRVVINCFKVFHCTHKDETRVSRFVPPVTLRARVLYSFIWRRLEFIYLFVTPRFNKRISFLSFHKIYIYIHVIPEIVQRARSFSIYVMEQANKTHVWETFWPERRSFTREYDYNVCWVSTNCPYSTNLSCGRRRKASRS